MTTEQIITDYYLLFEKKSSLFCFQTRSPTRVDYLMVIVTVHQPTRNVWIFLICNTEMKIDLKNRLGIQRLTEREREINNQ